MMNRRNFFRSLGVAAGAAVVPLPVKPSLNGLEWRVSSSPTWSGGVHVATGTFVPMPMLATHFTQDPAIMRVGKSISVNRPMLF